VAEVDPRTQEMVREAAALMGKLFINRRDRKAIYRPDRSGKWHWTAVEASFVMGDFVQHLTGEHCLGTYLLNTDNTVKFLAFDIDLQKQGKYWRCYDIDQILALEERGYGFDLDLKEGLLEDAFHIPADDAYRWTRIIVLEAIRTIVKAVRKLDLTPLTVITGGGAHVLVPFAESVAAADARLVGTHIVNELPTAAQINKMFWSYGPLGELTIEVFPKQDTLVGKDYGNLIRLPYGWHHEAAIRTFSIDPESLTTPLWEWNKISSLSALRMLNPAGAETEGTE
jgi:hypothetical protein